MWQCKRNPRTPQLIIRYSAVLLTINPMTVSDGFPMPYTGPQLTPVGVQIPLDQDNMNYRAYEINKTQDKYSLHNTVNCFMLPVFHTNFLCRRKLEHWSRGFDYQSQHECVSASAMCVLSCVGTGLSMERSFESYSMGTYDLRPAVKKALSVRPKVSASCVSYRDTTKPPEQTGKQTRRAARDTERARARTHTHHPTSKISTFFISCSSLSVFFDTQYC
jgi:hypothetical protein